MRVTVKENDWKFDAYGQEMTQPPSFSKTPTGGDHTDEIEVNITIPEAYLPYCAVISDPKENK